MRKARLLFAAMGILAMATFVAGAAEAGGTGHDAGMQKVELAPVPGVKAKGGADAEFTLGKDGATLHYVLRTKDVADITMGHIHEVAQGGAPGAIIAWLYPVGGQAPSLKPGKTTGVLAEGSIDSGKLAGPLKGGTVKELFERIREGKAGIAIHTKENPGGELWGVNKPARHAKSAHRAKKTM